MFEKEWDSQKHETSRSMNIISYSISNSRMDAMAKGEAIVDVMIVQ